MILFGVSLQQILFACSKKDFAFKKYNVSATYKLCFLNVKSIGFEKTYQGFVVTTPQKDHKIIQSISISNTTNYHIWCKRKMKFLHRSNYRLKFCTNATLWKVPMHSIGSPKNDFIAKGSMHIKHMKNEKRAKLSKYPSPDSNGILLRRCSTQKI